MLSKWVIVGAGAICLAAIIGGVIFTLNAFSQDKAPAGASVQAPVPVLIETPLPADSTAPVITDVSVLATGRTGAAITWTTDEEATSAVEYGLNKYYSFAASPDEYLVTSHIIILSGLTPQAKYDFRVKSTDAGGNESISDDYTLTTSKDGTLVNGTLSENTTWTESDSPYLIISTVQVPAGVTLTMNPGASVIMSGGNDYLFKVDGMVLAHGRPGNNITLDGGGHSFFTSENAGPDATVDLDYCTIKNGRSLINFARGFNLRHSEVTNLTQNSDISFGPTSDIYIEYNNFTNASGFITGGSTVNIRYNHFYSRNHTVQDTPWIINRAGPATMVNYNFFIETDGIAVMLEGGSGTESIEAAFNYWGTYNITTINAMIWDKHDDSGLASYIEYMPTRNSPEPIRLFTF